MTTLTVTLQGSKKGQLLYFTIEFAKSSFCAVVDAISEITTKEQLYSSKLWTVK